MLCRPRSPPRRGRGTSRCTRARTCFRGRPTTTSPGMEAVNPSTQHIPTTVILSESSCSVVCGCWCWWWCCGGVVRCLGRVAVGNLGVLPSGLSPRGAASFVHARLGCRGNQGSMVSKLPSPGPHTCSRPPVVPHVPSPPPGLRLPFWRASWCASFTGGVRLRATAAGRSHSDVRHWIRGARLGWDAGAAALPASPPDRAPVHDRGLAAG